MTEILLKSVIGSFLSSLLNVVTLEQLITVLRYFTNEEGTHFLANVNEIKKSQGFKDIVDKIIEGGNSSAN